MIKRISVIAIILFLCGGCAVIASKHHDTQKVASTHLHDTAYHNCAACHSLSKAEAGNLLKQFGQVQVVKLSPVKGLYEVTIQQGNQQMAAYIDFSKKLILAGRIYDIASRKMMTPLPAEMPMKLSKAQFERLKPDDSLIMGNRNGTKHMYVFTDPDCPYCKRLHEELKKLASLEPDLAICIKMYPLRMHPGAYDRARAILASGSLDTLNKAFAGGTLPAPAEKDSKKAVDETIQLAKSLGIEGTPALVFPDGRLIIGFRSAQDMHALLTPPAKQAAR
jgi:thiol:disulfide interchange protein DsbC